MINRGPKPAPLGQRLMKYVHITRDCWIWTGAKDKAGYGRISLGHANCKLAHRIAFIALAGPIPDGLDLHHCCENPTCINPAHCKPVTRKFHAQLSNTRQDFVDRFAAQWNRERSKTHCPKGHAYDLFNTYFSKNGERSCRKCHSEREILRQLRRRNGDTEKRKPWASH